MQWLALRVAWWPMAVAVAWVLLRSRQVVEQLLDLHPRKPITFTTVAIYAASVKAAGQPAIPGLENSEAAFRQLQHSLETGEIELVGTPFVRVGDLHGSSRLEKGNQQTIPYAEISSLTAFDDHGELCLIPRNWSAAHGSARTHLRGYRNPLVRSVALVRAFPEERTQLAHVPSDDVVYPASHENITVNILKQSTPVADQRKTGSAKPARKQRRRKGPTLLQQAVIQAIVRLWPDGQMPASAKTRDAEIAKAVSTVSGSTIRRVLRDHGRKIRKLRSG
jgi:hypothetical protein